MQLEDFDLDRGTAIFAGEEPRTRDAHARWSRLGAIAGRIGLRTLQLRSEAGLLTHDLPLRDRNGESEGIDAGSPVHVATLQCTGRLRPTVHRQGDGITYHFRVPRDMAHVTALSAAIGLVLTAHGDQERDLVPLRIALYEILANCAEHGVPHAHHPDHDQIELRMTLEPGRIHGQIEDRCEAFDPTAGTAVSVAERVALGHKRGLGLPMISQLLDRADHETGPEGNRVTFSRRIRP